MAKVEKFETASATYIKVASLGEGGSGRVLLVTDESGAEFALKIIAPERASKDRVRRFKNEIAFCRMNVHRGIVRVLDEGFFLSGDRKIPFYVMPRYDKTLRTAMAVRLAPERALALFVLILDAVEAAHLLDVWHRDLKPENILLGTSPQSDDLVVADFGIAHFSEELLATQVETSEGNRLANFAYSAPEQRRPGQTVDRRADIFALGLILHELMTGEVPQGKNHTTIESVSPDFGYLDPVVERMLNQSPANRHSTISEIKSDLSRRGLQSIAQQALLAEQKRVVPESQVPRLPPVGISSYDYLNSALVINLDRDPSPNWKHFFQNPPSGFSAFVGYEPSSFEVRGRTITRRAPENLVPQLAEHARDYIAKANIAVETDARRQAQANDQRARELHEQERKAAEARVRVLAKLGQLPR